MRGGFDARVVSDDPQPRVVPADAATAASQAPAPASDPVTAVAHIAGVVASSLGLIGVCVVTLTSTAVAGVVGRVPPRTFVGRYCKGTIF